MTPPLRFPQGRGQVRASAGRAESGDASQHSKYLRCAGDICAGSYRVRPTKTSYRV